MAFLVPPVGETRDGKGRLHGPPRDSGEVLGFGAFSTRQRGVGVWESDFKKRGYIITLIVLLDAEPSPLTEGANLGTLTFPSNALVVVSEPEPLGPTKYLMSRG